MGDERTKEKLKRMKKKRGRKKRNSGRKSVRIDIPFATQSSEPNTQITLRRPQLLLLSLTLYTRSQIRLAFPPSNPESGWSRNADCLNAYMLDMPVLRLLYDERDDR